MVLSGVISSLTPYAPAVGLVALTGAGFVSCVQPTDEITKFDMSKNDDSAYVLEKVKEDGLNLQYASERLKNDKEIVEAVTHRNWQLFQYASTELKNDKEFALVIIKFRKNTLRYVSEALRDDKDVVLAAASTAWSGYDLLRWASDRLRKDRAVVSHFFRERPENLQYAHEEVLADKKFMIDLINRFWYWNWDYYWPTWILQCASNSLKADKEVIMAAVARQGISLQHASANLKDDKEVVLAAVAQDKNALKFASPRLQNDPDVIAAAAE